MFGFGGQGVTRYYRHNWFFALIFFLWIILYAFFSFFTECLLLWLAKPIKDGMALGKLFARKAHLKVGKMYALWNLFQSHTYSHTDRWCGKGWDFGSNRYHIYISIQTQLTYMLNLSEKYKKKNSEQWQICTNSVGYYFVWHFLRHFHTRRMMRGREWPEFGCMANAQSHQTKKTYKKFFLENLKNFPEPTPPSLTSPHSQCNNRSQFPFPPSQQQILIRQKLLVVEWNECQTFQKFSSNSASPVRVLFPFRRPQQSFPPLCWSQHSPRLLLLPHHHPASSYNNSPNNNCNAHRRRPAPSFPYHHRRRQGPGYYYCII